MPILLHNNSFIMFSTKELQLSRIQDLRNTTESKNVSKFTSEAVEKYSLTIQLANARNFSTTKRKQKLTEY